MQEKADGRLFDFEDDIILYSMSQINRDAQRWSVFSKVIQIIGLPRGSSTQGRCFEKRKFKFQEIESLARIYSEIVIPSLLSRLRDILPILPDEHTNTVNYGHSHNHEHNQEIEFNFFLNFMSHTWVYTFRLLLARIRGMIQSQGLNQDKVSNMQSLCSSL